MCSNKKIKKIIAFSIISIKLEIKWNITIPYLGKLENFHIPNVSQKGGIGVATKKSKKIMAFSDSEQLFTKKKLHKFFF